MFLSVLCRASYPGSEKSGGSDGHEGWTGGVRMWSLRGRSKC